MKIQNLLKKYFNIAKVIFFYFVPRTLFSKKNGLHAQDRFFSRYKVEITRSEYEIINFMILLGFCKRFNSRKKGNALFEGNYKAVKFYAVFNFENASVVTFLKEKMIFHVLEKQPIKKINDDININECELINFDSHYNFSILVSPQDEFILYDHKEDKILQRDTEIGIIEEYIELYIE